MPQALRIRLPDGTTQALPLASEALTLGRSRECNLPFPEDQEMSKLHLRLEPMGAGWVAEDLGSKNGTRLNGQQLAGRILLRPGDLLEVGRLLIEYRDESMPASRPNLILDDDSPALRNTTTVVARLTELLESQEDGPAPLTGAARIRALLHAGRELAGHRPLNELFELILDLAVQAVGCTRGLLLTKEGGRLVSSAARGDSFRISSAVRDRVLEHRESVLVLDAQLDDLLRQRVSIVEQQVRSIMAVPLQTNDCVIGMIYVDSSKAVHPFTKEDLNLLTVLANVAAIRIEHVRLAEVEQAERLMAREMEQAAEIQRRLLPLDAPSMQGLDLAGFHAPCRTVGGDYYDFFEMLDGRALSVVGDVAGKGMPAALLMANLQARVQLLAEECRSITCVVSKLNRALSLHCPSNRFITFFACALNPADGEVTYCNAGHNPPFLIRASGEAEVLREGGIILGIRPAEIYEEHHAHLDCGDMLVLYSDGVTEATEAGKGEAGEDFGMERLAGVLSQNRGLSAHRVIDAVRDAVRAYSGGVATDDDLTLVVIKRT